MEGKLKYYHVPFFSVSYGRFMCWFLVRVVRNESNWKLLFIRVLCVVAVEGKLSNYPLALFSVS